MLSFEKLSKHALIFRAFSGLTIEEFNTLYLQIQNNYPTYSQKRLYRVDRQRNIGAGHPFKHALKNRLLMLLIYYKLYLTSTLAAYLFDLNQTNILKNIRILEPLVCEVLPLPKKLAHKTRRLRTLDEIDAIFPGFKAFLDSTEQPIPRPKNKHKQKTFYSGKKKKHTVKTQIGVNKNGLIVHKAKHTKGSTHDYALFRRSHLALPSNVELGLDLGYDGAQVDFPNLKCKVPFKRRSPGRGKRGVKAKPLSLEQQAFNRELSSERVVVEHIFSRVKKFRIWADEFRNRLKHYETMTNIVCGLVNFRILQTTQV